jgi:hypothetical protein
MPLLYKGLSHRENLVPKGLNQQGAPKEAGIRPIIQKFGPTRPARPVFLGPRNPTVENIFELPIIAPLTAESLMMSDC